MSVLLRSCVRRNVLAILAAVISGTVVGCTGDASDPRGGGCAGGDAAGVSGEIALAKCLTADSHIPPTATTLTPDSVVFFIDRSLSMRGFLDPGYPTQDSTDYRAVLDRVTVGLRPSRAYSFGVAVRPVALPLSELTQKGFYEDRDTRMEQAIDTVARDTSRRRSYVIVGDARRGGPATALAQFARMRQVAQDWVGAGGSFVVAASMAPFSPIKEDPSGCRRVGGTTQDDRRCPLYAFAFAREGDALPIAATLAQAFQHVFVWPVVTVPSGQIDVRPLAPVPPQLQVHPTWSEAADGTPIVRVSATSSTASSMYPFAITTRDSSSELGRGLAGILDGMARRGVLTNRSFTVGSAKSNWAPAGGAASLIQPAEQPRVVHLTSRGPGNVRSVVRLDLLADGNPSWLSTFDAASAADALRTFGLGTLFTPFRLDAAKAATSPNVRPVARVFFVVN